MDFILRYFTEFGSFRWSTLRKSGWRCRRKKFTFAIISWWVSCTLLVSMLERKSREYAYTYIWWQKRTLVCYMFVTSNFGPSYKTYWKVQTNISQSNYILWSGVEHEKGNGVDRMRKWFIWTYVSIFLYLVHTFASNYMYRLRLCPSTVLMVLSLQMLVNFFQIILSLADTVANLQWVYR